MRSTGFNPQARWDRHVPENSSLEYRLNEKIEALVWFKGARVYPRLFIWKNKKYKIQVITYQWQERRGQEFTSCFAVNTGFDLYQISFNSTTLGWRLDKIIE